MFITHDLSLLLELADRIAVMYAGQLLEIGTAAEIHREPSHPYTKGLLNSFPSLRGPRRDLAGIPGSPPDLRDPPPGCPISPPLAGAGQADTRKVYGRMLRRVGRRVRRGHRARCGLSLGSGVSRRPGHPFDDSSSAVRSFTIKAVN